MPVVKPENLFPLPFTAFERFMLGDESSDYPMVFYLQVKLQGTVDRDVMKQAVEESLSRHPLLCSRAETTWRGGHWVWTGDQVPDADWNPEHWNEKKPWTRAIDLRTENGLRVWGEQHPDHAIITMQFHHACCDGIGAAQFLEDVAVSYARHYATTHGSGEELPEFRPINLQLLKTRNSPEERRVANLPGSILQRMQIVIKYTVRYLRQRKMPLLSRGAVGDDQGQSGLRLISSKLTRAETRGLREAAKQYNSSINDLLVSELMLLCHRWNESIEVSRTRRFSFKQPTMCVLVPTSLRGPSDGELPCCNVVSYVFMARELSLMDQPDELLRTIRDEMQLVHKHQAGWMFVQAIEALQRLPGMLRLIMLQTRNSCMSTTVLSHTGNLLNAIGSRLPRQGKSIKMGNLLVEDVCGVPPIRKGTAAAFSTVMINGCLSISLRCCPERFSDSDTKQLLEIFAEQLKLTASPRNDSAASSSLSSEKTSAT